MPVAASRPHHNLSKSDFVVGEALRLAVAIAKWRNEAGLTQDQMAADVGISKAMLSAIETCRSRPSFDVFVSLRRAMGLPSISLPGPIPALTSGSDKP